MAIRLVFQVILSIMAIWWLYNRMGLFTKAHRRIEQLYYPFAMADYSIDTLLEVEKIDDKNRSYWDNILSLFGYSSSKNYQSSNNASRTNEDETKVKICQQILLELGQEVLSKRADWMLAVTDRNLQSPK